MSHYDLRRLGESDRPDRQPWHHSEGCRWVSRGDRRTEIRASELDDPHRAAAVERLVHKWGIRQTLRAMKDWFDDESGLPPIDI